MSSNSPILKPKATSPTLLAISKLTPPGFEQVAGSIQERLRTLGPEASKIVDRISPLCNESAHKIGKRKRGRKKNRKNDLTRGATLAEAYPRHPNPFDALFTDCRDLIENWTHNHRSPSQLVVERVFSVTAQALNAVYQAQLLFGELKFGLAAGLVGPDKNVLSWDNAISRAASMPIARVWGNSVQRQVLNQILEDAQRGILVGKPSYRGTPILHKVLTPLEVVEAIIRWQPKLYEQFLLWGDKPCIKVFGTARSKAVSDTSRNLMDYMLPLFLGEKVSLISGLGDQGIMGEISSRARNILNSLDYETDEVLIGGTPLRFLTFHGTEQTDTRSVTPGAIAPGQIMFESRTPLLYALGLSVGNFFFPGGFGTDEEKARLLLSQQLRELVQTPVPHQTKIGRAPNFLIDQPSSQNDGQGWFWDPDIAKIQEEVAAGTVSPAQVHSTFVIRIGEKKSEEPKIQIGGLEVYYFSNEQEAAAFIFKQSSEFIKSANKRAKIFRERVSDAIRVLEFEKKLVRFPLD